MRTEVFNSKLLPQSLQNFGHNDQMEFLFLEILLIVWFRVATRTVCAYLILDFCILQGVAIRWDIITDCVFHSNTFYEIDQPLSILPH